MFDFQNAEVSKNNFKETITPGVHVVKVVKVENGINTNAGTPYLEVTVETSNGSAELKNRYSLNTTINPGKQMSGWDVTKNALLSIVAASGSFDEVTAKTKMPQAKSAEELAQKLAVLLTGKEFRLKITGEEKISQKGNLYIASNFSNGVFCESLKVAETKLFFNADKNIKRLPAEAKADVEARLKATLDMSSNVQKEGFSQNTDEIVF